MCLFDKTVLLCIHFAWRNLIISNYSKINFPHFWMDNLSFFWVLGFFISRTGTQLGLECLIQQGCSPTNGRLYSIWIVSIWLPPGGLGSLELPHPRLFFVVEAHQVILPWPFFTVQKIKSIEMLSICRWSFIIPETWSGDLKISFKEFILITFYEKNVYFVKKKKDQTLTLNC